MNKELFSHFGWIVIVAVIMAALMVVATPFGVYVGDGMLSIFSGYKQTGDAAQGDIDKKGKEWENMLYDDETYTAIFETDGGIWGTGGSSTKTVSYDAKTTLKAPDTVSREGASFMGWKVTVEAGNWEGTFFDTSDQQKLSGDKGKYGNVTFTAQWTNGEYTATFLPNGGSWQTSSGTDVARKVSYSKDTTITLPFGISRTGYTFIGWKVTKADGNWIQDKIFSENDVKTVTTSTGYHGNPELTAQWKVNTYDITYDFAGGKSAKDSLPSNVAYGTSFTVLRPTREGYTFAGWNITGMDTTSHTLGTKKSTATSANNINETDFMNLRASDGTVKMTATWNANTYNIVYDFAKGSGSTDIVCSTKPSSGTYGQDIVISNPTREGYTFEGWTISGCDTVKHYYGNTAKYGTHFNDTGLDIKTKATHFMNLRATSGTVKFTAHWIANSYYVTSAGRNIESITPVSSTEYFDRGFTVKWVGKTGYHIAYAKLFSGTQPDGKVLNGVETSYNNKYSTIPPKEGQYTFTMKGKYYDKANVYVCYDPNEMHIKFNTNDSSGSKAINPNSNMTVYYDQEFTVKQPTRLGYKFVGWKVSGPGIETKIYNTSTTKFKNLTTYHMCDITFTAQWRANTYNISYNLNQINGSTEISLSPKPTSATYDVEFSLGTPKRDGYTFAGWKITGMDNTTHIIRTSDGTKITTKNTNHEILAKSSKNITYYFTNLTSGSNKVTFQALWTPIEYTVKFNGNQPEANDDTLKGTDEMKDLPMTFDKSKNLTKNKFAISNGVTDGLYVFQGWNTKADGTGNSYENIQEINRYNNMTTKDGDVITLYAQWKPLTYNVLYTLFDPATQKTTTKTITVKYDEYFELWNGDTSQTIDAWYAFDNYTKYGDSDGNGIDDGMWGSVNQTVRNLAAKQDYTVKAYGRKAFTVTYDTNASGCNNQVAQKTYTYTEIPNATHTIRLYSTMSQYNGFDASPDWAQEPTKQWKIAYWTTNKDGSGTKYQAVYNSIGDTSFSVTENTTLYAKWERRTEDERYGHDYQSKSEIHCLSGKTWEECSRCHTKINEKTNNGYGSHAYGNYYSLNTSQHARKCSRCSYQEITGHANNSVTTSATCTGVGGYTPKCNTCGYVGSFIKTSDALGHYDGKNGRAEAKGTCTTNHTYSACSKSSIGYHTKSGWFSCEGKHNKCGCSSNYIEFKYYRHAYCGRNDCKYNPYQWCVTHNGHYGKIQYTCVGGR